MGFWHNCHLLLAPVRTECLFLKYIQGCIGNLTSHHFDGISLGCAASERRFSSSCCEEKIYRTDRQREWRRKRRVENVRRKRYEVKLRKTREEQKERRWEQWQRGRSTKRSEERQKERGERHIMDLYIRVHNYNIVIPIYTWYRRYSCENLVFMILNEMRVLRLWAIVFRALYISMEDNNAS